MTLRMDPLIERMVKYFEHLLCEVDDYYPCKIATITRQRAMLGLFQIDGWARPAKKKGRQTIWKATTKLCETLGQVAANAQPHPASQKCYDQTRSCGQLSPQEEKYWEYYWDHLSWVFQLKIYACFHWMRDDLRIVNQWGQLSSTKAQALLKFTRKVVLRSALKDAAKELISEIDFDRLIGDTLPPASARDEPNDTCPSPSEPTPAEQADFAAREVPSGFNGVAMPGTLPS